MKYCFNLKLQVMYGIVTFLVALSILYIFTKKLDFLTSVTIGLVEFIASGYFTINKCKKIKR